MSIGPAQGLHTIKNIEDMVADRAGWAALSDDTRQQHMKVLEENKGATKGSAGLCTETLHMFNYLTTDETLRGPFLSREILPHFASLMLSVMRELTGAKSLELKVDNFESYGFDPKVPLPLPSPSPPPLPLTSPPPLLLCPLDPKRMLQEVCLTTVHFAASESFQRAVPSSGYYEQGKPMRKAFDTCAKFGLISADDKATLAQFCDKVQAAAASYQDLDELLANPPDEFVDPVLATIMSDPVRLPSGNVVNMSTIEKHLLNQASNQRDPFNNQPMTIKDVVPLPDLKAQIEAWIESKKNGTA